MPTYQYVCESCDESFERVQAFTDPTLTVHDDGCGGPVRKRFSAVGVVFKGAGFYRNDSRTSGSPQASNGNGELAGKGDGAKTDGGKGDSAKGEGGKGDAAKAGTGTGDSGKGDSSKGDSSKPSARTATPASTPATPSTPAKSPAA